jgi:hypothetical protein
MTNLVELNREIVTNKYMATIARLFRLQKNCKNIKMKSIASTHITLLKTAYSLYLGNSAISISSFDNMIKDAKIFLKEGEKNA